MVFEANYSNGFNGARKNRLTSGFGAKNHISSAFNIAQSVRNNTVRGTVNSIAIGSNRGGIGFTRRGTIAGRFTNGNGQPRLPTGSQGGGVYTMSNESLSQVAAVKPKPTINYQAIVNGTEEVSGLDYARVVLAVAKGDFELDGDGLNSLAERVNVDHNLIDELFVNGRDLNGSNVEALTAIANAQTIIETYRLMIDDGAQSSSASINGISLGAVDPAREGVLSEIIDLIDPNATKFIELHSHFDTDGDFSISDDELTQGLIAFNSGDFGNYSSAVLDAVTALNSNVTEIRAFINKVDPDSDGEMIMSDYAALQMSIAQGRYALPAGADVILEGLKDGNADYDLIDDAINGRTIDGQTVPGFAAALAGDDVGVLDLVKTFRLMVDDGAANGADLDGVTLGQVEMARNQAVTEALAGIYPQGDQLVYLFSNFDSDRDFQILEEELINGSFDYNQGILGSVSPGVLKKINELNPTLDQVQYVLNKIDINADGEVSHRELVRGLLAIKQGDFIEDELYDDTAVDIGSGVILDKSERLFRTVLARHENYEAVRGVLESFDLGETKPSRLGLAALLKVKQASGHSYAAGVEETFFDVIEMTNVEGLSDEQQRIRTKQLEDLDEIITEIGALDASAFTSTGLKIELVYDKLFSIYSGQTKASLPLVAILGTNADYQRAVDQMKRYLPGGTFNQESLIALAVDTNVGDEKLTAVERGYFDDFLQGNYGALTVADYEAAFDDGRLDMNLIAQVLLDADLFTPIVDQVALDSGLDIADLPGLTEAQRIGFYAQAFQDDLIAASAVQDLAMKALIFADDIKDLDISEVTRRMENYKRAAEVLDPDTTGSMTRSDYYAHSYYFSDYYARSYYSSDSYAAGVPGQYDFDKINGVDEKDREIFFDVSKYLLSNG